MLNRLIGWAILGTGVALLAVSLAVLSPGSSSAYHSSGLHITSMHTLVTEDFCAKIEDGSMSQGTAYSRIRDTLYVAQPSQDWDGLAGNKVFFFGRSAPVPGALASSSNTGCEAPAVVE